MMFSIYLFGKFLVYCAVCAMAVPMLQLPVKNRHSFAWKWGTLRFILSFPSAFAIGALLSFATKLEWVNAGTPDLAFYLLGFATIRYLVWNVMLLLISSRHLHPVTFQDQKWVLLGLLANLACDGVLFLSGDFFGSFSFC